jgi:hypothetical protein
VHQCAFGKLDSDLIRPLEWLRISKLFAELRNEPEGKQSRHCSYYQPFSFDDLP